MLYFALFFLFRFSKAWKEKNVKYQGNDEIGNGLETEVTIDCVWYRDQHYTFRV